MNCLEYSETIGLLLDETLERKLLLEHEQNVNRHQFTAALDRMDYPDKAI